MNPFEIAKIGQSGPYPAKMSVFTESGHCPDLKTAKSPVCFRPEAMGWTPPLLNGI
jgi:hypothetical protein